MGTTASGGLATTDGKVAIKTSQWKHNQAVPELNRLKNNQIADLQSDQFEKYVNMRDLLHDKNEKIHYVKANDTQKYNNERTSNQSKMTADGIRI